MSMQWFEINLYDTDSNNKIIIQPNPELDGCNLRVEETDGKGNASVSCYFTKEQLKHLIENLQFFHDRLEK
jgi:hypothetical protein